MNDPAKASPRVVVIGDLPPRRAGLMALIASAGAMIAVTDPLTPLGHRLLARERGPAPFLKSIHELEKIRKAEEKRKRKASRRTTFQPGTSPESNNSILAGANSEAQAPHQRG